MQPNQPTKRQTKQSTGVIFTCRTFNTHAAEQGKSKLKGHHFRKHSNVSWDSLQLFKPPYSQTAEVIKKIDGWMESKWLMNLKDTGSRKTSMPC